MIATHEFVVPKSIPIISPASAARAYLDWEYLAILFN
jgi:hypothetical protein